MREIPFTMKLPEKIARKAGFAGKERGGSGITVQGIIDCVFLRDGKLYLLDFKSDRIYGDPAEHSERYRIQLEIYAAACRAALGRAPDEALLYYLRHGKKVSLTL